MKPLFIPLKKEYFQQFKNGTKTKSRDGLMIEFRKYGPRWNERTITPNREVVLSLGYSGERITATIIRLEIIKNTITDLYSKNSKLAAIHLCIQMPQ